MIERPAGTQAGLRRHQTVTLLLCLGLWFGPASAEALPVYRKMVKQKSGRLVSCLLCHDKDSWEPNAFGLEFLKAGRTSAALEKVGGMDIDQDGAPDLEELRAGASPVDPGSTPKSPGDWLKQLSPLRPPEKQLRVLFPGATSFAAVEEGELKPLAVKRLAKNLGRGLREEERLQVYYEAFGEGARLGSATYVSTEDEDPAIFLLGLNEEGRVAGVLKVHSPKKLDMEFLGGLAGMDGPGLAKLEKEPLPSKENSAIARVVRSAAAALAARLIR